MKSLSLFIVLLALVIITSAGLYWRASYREPAVLLASETTTQAITTDVMSADDVPEYLSIPAIEARMAVKSASVSGNTWDIYDDAASWLNSSGTLQKGNMVIYAHNNGEMLGRLTDLEPGSVIEVGSSNRRVMYEVTDSFEGKATDVHFVNERVTRLTLYTCSGPLDTRRYFVFAEPIAVESI